MVEAAFWLFGGIAVLVGLFFPTLVALYRRSDRLFVTLLANCTVFLIGPLGTLLALFVLAAPQPALDGFNAKLRDWKINQQPRTWRERSCPVCKEWMLRTASACPSCHAKVEPLDQACPACQRPMPPTASVCQACGYDQTVPTTYSAAR